MGEPWIEVGKPLDRRAGRDIRLSPSPNGDREMPGEHYDQTKWER